MKNVYVLSLLTICVASVTSMAYPRAIDGGNGTPLKAAFAPLQALESASRVKRQTIHKGYGYQSDDDSQSTLDNMDGQNLDNGNNFPLPPWKKK